ncbi:MAG: hybrid sensor histidine kinase/response regulator, partial [Chthoniobacterales bacterium]
TFIDITERKRAEDQLKTSYREINDLKAALDEHAIVAITDPEGKITYVNDKFCAISKYSREELLGQDHRIIKSGFHSKEFMRDLWTTIARGEVWKAEVNNKAKDGSFYWVSSTIVPFLNEQGKPRQYVAIRTDITERKQAEDALRASEAHLQTVVENLNEGVVVCDLNGKLLHWNRAALEIHGIANVDDGARKLTELVDTFELSAIDGTRIPVEEWPLSRILRGESLHDLELRVRNIKTGLQRIFNYGGTLVHDANNQPLLGVVTISDITERKQTEDLIRASEVRYRALFESNPSPMWVYDLETLSFLAVNAAAVKHYGYSQDEFRAMTIKDIRPSEDIPALDDLSQKNDHLDHSKQWRHCTKDGRLNDVEITSHELTWLGRRAKVVLINDITERKRAEETLREQTDIINRAHDAIIIRNFENESITFWNKGAEHLYGWNASEAIGRTIGDLIFGGPKEREEPLNVLLSTGEFHGEIKQVTKDGREIMVDCRATLVREAAGQARSVLLINTDVTEQKKLETQLLRAQRLESIGTLASGVAHDLNNILTPILICAEVLRENTQDEDSIRTLQLIDYSARRGAAIVKQVLTFARRVEGKRVLIKPSHLIQELVDIAQKTFPKSIEIKSAYSDEVWSIEADPTQLHQVLLNLSVNARDAMPNGGVLTVAAENFEVDENYASMISGAKSGAHVMLRVSDTGSGMPRSVIEKIFDPFFTTKEIGKGTGLGLSTALGIVKSHGGFVSVYSEVGAGTTFKIFLPAQMSDVGGGKSKVSLESLNGNGELILVVDDEPNILGVTKMILEKHNYQVLAANDGPEALASIAEKKSSIHAVLTDISMPYMSGVAVVRATRKMKPEMLFIASTGQGEEAHVSELRSLGVTNLLAKPYDSAKLLQALHDALLPA